MKPMHLLLPLLAILLASACASSPGPASREVTWKCSEEMTFDAVADDISARLRILGDEQVLERTRSDEGARYANEDAVFWIRGQSAMLELNDREYDCKVDRMIEMARDAGIDFRALGQEPGWILDIHDGRRYILQYDYGKQRVSIPWSEPEVLEDGSRIHFVDTKEGALKIVIEPSLCTDSMTGRAYPFRVKVAWQDIDLAGCGREL